MNFLRFDDIFSLAESFLPAGTNDWVDDFPNFQLWYVIILSLEGSVYYITWRAEFYTPEV